MQSWPQTSAGSHLGSKRISQASDCCSASLWDSWIFRKNHMVNGRRSSDKGHVVPSQTSSTCPSPTSHMISVSSPHVRPELQITVEELRATTTPELDTDDTEPRFT